MDKIYDVYGIGNPLIDLLAKIEDNVLEKLKMHKGTMHLIDLDRRKEILEEVSLIAYIPGGSCANTIQAAADFGLKVIYSGSIADDEFGRKFEHGMKEGGVITDLKFNSLPTGSSTILISPDAERTQNTYLGACQQYNINDIDEEKIAASEWLYFTGYMWDTNSQKEALTKAIEVAKNNDTKIVFDVADPFAVSRSKEDFVKIMKDGVYFVLANFEEAKMFTGKDSIPDMIEELRSYNIQMGVIKDGGNGSVIFDRENSYKIPIFKVNAVDTTGAGDMYAAGILYGLVKGYDLERTGRIASYVAAKVVEGIGARLEYSLKGKIDEI
ncbi:MAG: adenosine kinase [Candidatus Heimdallarchaeota archaeon]|nr:adenosine kinase [Candidatus Heimdallarchaeota archaeon]